MHSIMGTIAIANTVTLYIYYDISQQMKAKCLEEGHLSYLHSGAVWASCGLENRKQYSPYSSPPLYLTL